MADRTARLVGSIDLAATKGLELGPLNNPVVRRSDGDIRYLDDVDTEALRERYASHEGFDLDSIVPIDYVSWTGSISSAVGDDAPFDYVIASHVIEHVPDLIRWLGDIRSVLVDGGVLSLAIPDHRRCFDALRTPTVAGEIVQAYLDHARVPSPRQLFDHYASAVNWRGQISWGEEPPFGELLPVHSEAEAWERTTGTASTGGYEDVHCWVFTPRSFCRVIGSLQRLQLVPFSVEVCTESIGGEFFATLRTAEPWDATVPVNDEGSPRAAEGAVVRQELAEARAALDSAQAELTAIKRSRSWRITKPLRGLKMRRSRPR
ncbi:MAG: class I SAM-dependent methyltransferase [Ilumatobacteraceae bacterium]